MKKRIMFPLLIALCVIATLTMTVGVAQARFRENWTETLPFQPVGEENLILRQDSNWVEEQNTKKLTFSLENIDTEISQGKIYVLVSQGVEKADKLKITLSYQGRNYTAQAQPIVQGSAVHRSFGDGWVYAFLDDQGQEKNWILQPEDQQTFQLNVESNAAIDYPSLVRLAVTKAENP